MSRFGGKTVHLLGQRALILLSISASASLFRASLRFSEKEPQKGQVDRLQTYIQFSFAVLPKPSGFFQLAEGTFYDPKFRETAKICSSLRLTT